MRAWNLRLNRKGVRSWWSDAEPSHPIGLKEFFNNLSLSDTILPGELIEPFEQIFWESDIELSLGSHALTLP